MNVEWKLLLSSEFTSLSQASWNSPSILLVIFVIKIVIFIIIIVGIFYHCTIYPVVDVLMSSNFIC